MDTPIFVSQAAVLELARERERARRAAPRNTDTSAADERARKRHERWRNKQVERGIGRKNVRAPLAALQVIERIALKTLAGEPLEQVLRELSPTPRAFPELRTCYFEAKTPGYVKDALLAKDPAAVWLGRQLDALNKEHRRLHAEGLYIGHKLDIARAYEDAGMSLYGLRGKPRRVAFYQVGLNPKDLLPAAPAEVVRELLTLKEPDDGSEVPKA
ncbi:MAG TPA: hypothetical protein VMV87_14500 [Burkholderiales bacterium]|nr:hypothetical protein [Burkholderiales bacterium]